MSGGWALVHTKASYWILRHLVIIGWVSLVEEVNLRSTSLVVLLCIHRVLEVTVIQVLSLIRFLLPAGRSLPLIVLIEVWTKRTLTRS